MTLTISQPILLALATQAAQCAARDGGDLTPSHVRLEVKDGQLQADATDYDHWLSVNAACEGQFAAGAGGTPAGAVMVNAERLVAAVSGLNASTVSMALDGNSLKLTGGGRRSLPVFAVQPIPMPYEENPTQVAIDAASLRQALKFCLPHIHDNMVTHGHLCGVRFQLEDGSAVAMATNGTSVVSIALAATGGEFKVTLGKRFLDLLGRSIPEIGAVDFAFGERLVCASWPGGSLTSKMIEVPFPDIQRALRKISTHRLSLHGAEMAAALDAIADFGAQDRSARSTVVRLRMNGSVTLAAVSESGSGSEELAADWDGPEDYSIGLASAHVLRTLKGFGANPVVIEMNEPDKPMIFRSDSLPDRVGVVAPFRV